MKIILIGLALLVLWSIWGYFSSNVEQAEYSIIREADTYEVRQYAPHIEAQTVVKGAYSDALNEGFSIVAGYIFGGNSRKESIAMTAPVREQNDTSEKIAMTAPVVSHAQGDSRIIAFVMPRGYTLETLPTPTDSRVQLIEVPEKKIAALRFTWFISEKRIKAMEERLLQDLKRDGVEVVGTPSYAGYNAPWTPPWMVRNEVLVEVK